MLISEQSVTRNINSKNTVFTLFIVEMLYIESAFTNLYIVKYFTYNCVIISDINHKGQLLHKKSPLGILSQKRHDTFPFLAKADPDFLYSD